MNNLARLLCIASLLLLASDAGAQTSSLMQSGSIGGLSPAAAPTFNAQTGVPSANALSTPTLTAPSGAGPGPAAVSPAAVGPAAVEPATAAGNPVYLQSASWTHQPAPPMRVFRKNDIVTVRVDKITRVLAEGSAETRKRTLFETVLDDWIRLTNFRLRPDPQGFGDPAVSIDSNNNYRAESEVETRESMTFNIATKIVDVRPNGTILLEGREAIRVNDNLWETSLSGACRVADVGPDNVVLSRDLIDLEIKKEDRGHLRDGYRRGWFQRWLDRAGPF